MEPKTRSGCARWIVVRQGTHILHEIDFTVELDEEGKPVWETWSEDHTRSDVVCESDVFDDDDFDGCFAGDFGYCDGVVLCKGGWWWDDVAAEAGYDISDDIIESRIMVQQLAILSIRYDSDRLYDDAEVTEVAPQHQAWCLGSDGSHQSMASWYEESVIIDLEDIDDVIEWLDEHDIYLKRVELISEPGKINYGDSGDAYGFWKTETGWTIELGDHPDLEPYQFNGKCLPET